MKRKQSNTDVSQPPLVFPFPVPFSILLIAPQVSWRLRGQTMHKMHILLLFFPPLFPDFHLYVGISGFVLKPIFELSSSIPRTSVPRLTGFEQSGVFGRITRYQLILLLFNTLRTVPGFHWIPGWSSQYIWWRFRSMVLIGIFDWLNCGWTVWSSSSGTFWTIQRENDIV